MSDGRTTYKYNPAFLSEDELVRAFVVRDLELELIVQTLRENVGPSNQHLLVVGPRGIGKTMLVLRVAAEVNRDETLRERWYPLVFAEETYQAHTPGEFWLEALFHLHRQTREERWKVAHDELRRERDEDRLRERALSQLMDFAGQRGKRILLVVENLHMLLGEQITAEDAWVLRHTLLNEPRVMLLATATTRFAEVERSDKALFDLLKIHDLPALDEAGCRAVWAAIAGRQPPANRIRPIQILTGGNPRLLAIISTFGARRSFGELMTELMQLVDEHTDYFKSHLDNLAPVERKVYLALAELWQPAGAREVAEAARLEVSKTSALLLRLAKRGAVAVCGQDGRSKQYQLAERIYNIYYLMRRRRSPSSRVRALVNFMVGFYGPEGDGDLRHTLASTLCAGRKTEEALEHTKRYLEDAAHVERRTADTINLLVDLAAIGCGPQALDILRDSPSAGLLEPLVVGLALYIGEDVKAPAEIVEVARDVVKRIEGRRGELEARG